MILLNGGGASALITDAKQLRDAELVRLGCEVLEKAYPGHIWRVQVVDELMSITMGAFRGMYQMVVHTWNYNGGELDKAIARAGGEFMERNGIARQGRTESTYDPHTFGWMRQAKPGD